MDEEVKCQKCGKPMICKTGEEGMPVGDGLMFVWMCDDCLCGRAIYVKPEEAPAADAGGEGESDDRAIT